MSAADHVVGAFRKDRPVDQNWLLKYFAAGGASYDDLLALAYLEQRDPGEHDELGSYVRALRGRRSELPPAGRDQEAFRPFRPCSPRLAVGSAGWSARLAVGIARAESPRLAMGLAAWCPGPARDLAGPAVEPARRLSTAGGGPHSGFRPESCGPRRSRCRAGASSSASSATARIRRVPVSRVAVSEADAVVDGRLPVTPLNLLDVLGSWPVYLERGRRGITAAPRVVVSDVDELVDSCSWIDWAKVLDNERVVITTADPASVPARGPEAKTDLSFIFDPNARIGTVGGGLMDQVTHIALFDDLCTPHGLDYYLDDLRYTWWRSHNGFEASRLAPDLERRRITRLVSQALIESFRDEVMKTRLPWVFNQSRAWYDLGLREATVVTRDYFNSRRLMEIGPEFPVRVYTEEEELGELIREPPSPICFYTTQHRIPIVPESAAAIRRVFSYHHLEASGLDPDVARTADLLRSAPHVAFHVRRGDFLHPHFDTGWLALPAEPLHRGDRLPHRVRARDERLQRGGVLRRPRVRRGSRLRLRTRPGDRRGPVHPRQHTTSSRSSTPT